MWGASPSVLYLTWMHDPTTTMTVQWHTSKEDQASVISYKENGEWKEEKGSFGTLYGSDVVVHTVELSGLEPGGEYEFRIPSKGNEIYRFRTLPANLDTPLRFVVGGDAYFYLSRFQKMNRQIAALNPDFVVVGGDIAYTVNSRALFKGKGWELNRWRRFFKEWKRQMVTSDGRLIPIVPVVGNHDIRQTALVEKHEHFFFYELFALGEPGVSYRTMDVGNYLSLFLLDTGHSFHIEGQQTKWLADQLSARQNRPYKFAAYHIGAYPSAYPFYGNIPKRIRYYWSPLFERYEVQLAFEHHNHAYKRTYPMKRGRMNPGGVVYMGDGSWGVNPRQPKEMWYLEKAAKINAVNFVTLTKEGATVEAVDNQGMIVDQISVSPHISPAVWNGARCLPGI